MRPNPQNARIALLTASRWKEKQDNRLLSRALDDASPDIRIAALRIIADKKIGIFTDTLRNMLPAEDNEGQLHRIIEAALKELGN